MQLKAPIQYVKGVGPTRAEAFQKLSVTTVGALLRYYPRAYEDWSHIVPIREMPENETLLHSRHSLSPADEDPRAGRIAAL